MRMNCTFILFLFTAVTASAQIRKIPAEVTGAFSARYPHAEKVAWKDNLTAFEARFTLNNYLMSAAFNGKGEWQYSEKKMQFDELPQSVKDGFNKSKYAEREKGSVMEIDKNGEAIEYRILVKKSGLEKKYLFFDINGRLKREAITL